MSKKRKLRYFIVNKPYNMLSQFTKEHGKSALCDLDKLPNDVYPVGRLDFDSEGLLLLTNDKSLNQLILNPTQEHSKTYLAQVEGVPTIDELYQFKTGLTISAKGNKHLTLPAQIEIIPQPEWIKERSEPVRKDLTTCWLKITITEGKNRQVRKMTAAINHPTLRLIRHQIENLSVEGLDSGKFIELSRNTILKKLNITPTEQ